MPRIKPRTCWHADRPTVIVRLDPGRRRPCLCPRTSSGNRPARCAMRSSIPSWPTTHRSRRGAPSTPPRLHRRRRPANRSERAARDGAPIQPSAWPQTANDQPRRAPGARAEGRPVIRSVRRAICAGRHADREGRGRVWVRADPVDRSTVYLPLITPRNPPRFCGGVRVRGAVAHDAVLRRLTGDLAGGHRRLPPARAHQTAHLASLCPARPAIVATLCLPAEPGREDERPRAAPVVLRMLVSQQGRIPNFH